MTPDYRIFSGSFNPDALRTLPREKDLPLTNIVFACRTQIREGLVSVNQSRKKTSFRPHGGAIDRASRFRRLVNTGDALQIELMYQVWVCIQSARTILPHSRQPGQKKKARNKSKWLCMCGALDGNDRFAVFYPPHTSLGRQSSACLSIRHFLLTAAFLFEQVNDLFQCQSNPKKIR